MDFVIFFFLLSWKYQRDMDKLRAEQALAQADFSRLLAQSGTLGGAGAAIQAASVAAAVCVF